MTAVWTDQEPPTDLFGIDDPFLSDSVRQPGPAAPKLASSMSHWSDIGPSVLDRLEAAGENPGALIGIPTGFAEIDGMLNGLQAGRLYLVGALTGGGKSVFLGDMFRTWIDLRIPACFISLEMDRDEIWLRQASAACEIEHGRLQSGQLTDTDWTKLARWVGHTDAAPAWVCDPPAASIGDLSAFVLHGVETYGWQVVIIDYAQKIVAPSNVNREQAVASIAVGLKKLAREASIPVVVGAQLNREANRRPGGEPRLSDLRESAALEHELDAGILIHRPDYDDPKHPRAGEADLLVKKNRAGRKGTVTVAAQLQYQRFRSFTDDEMSACVACYAQHPGPSGSKCRTCDKPRGNNR
jgi:replicative DNA helicase